MICKRCMVVMETTGTTYEQQKERKNNFLHRRFCECKKCGNRIYIKTPNFQEILTRETEKNRNK